MTTTQERPILQRRISHAKDWALSIPAHYSALRASPHTTDHISYRRTEETFITLFRRTKLFSLARHAWMIITSTRTGRFSIGEYLRRKDVPYLQKQVVSRTRLQDATKRHPFILHGHGPAAACVTNPGNADHWQLGPDSLSRSSRGRILRQHANWALVPPEGTHTALQL